ncbi:MAG TPA: glycosyltransferase [Acidimicrobiales bacterium]|nr:glycosyltransferase [Acidimicrobiales bacterium]
MAWEGRDRSARPVAVAGDGTLHEPPVRRRRVLVVTGDVVGPGMAGPAIRAWHVAGCLAEEHDVVLATTSGRCRGAGVGFRLVAPDATGFEQLAAWCEIVVVQGFVLLHVPALRRADRIMIVDGYDILHLEALEFSKRTTDGSRAAHVETSLEVLNEQAARGDFFVCASEKQRDYWIGHLSALGRVNAATYGHDPLLRSLVDVVPFGLPPGAPVRTGPGPRETLEGIGPDDDVLLWAGGIYDWLDPTTLVRAVERLRHRRPQVRLVFMGTRHPNPEVPIMAMAEEARDVARSLGIDGTHVFFNDGWVDYDDRQNWLLDADVGVSTHFEHAETAFAFRTRLLDYLWAGLPVVATSGDAFADLIVREGLGRVVEPEDVGGLEQALDELLSDPEAVAACRSNVARVRGGFEWPTALGPLLRFCRDPARAPDRALSASRAEVHGRLARLKRRSRTAASLYAQGGAPAVLEVARQQVRRARRRAAARRGPSGTGYGDAY